MRSSMWALGVVAILGLLAMGCGDDSDSDTSGTDTAPTEEKAAE